MCPDLCQLIGAFMLCFRALLTTYDFEKCTKHVYWVVYIEIRLRTASKSAKNHCKTVFFRAFFVQKSYMLCVHAYNNKKSAPSNDTISRAAGRATGRAHIDRHACHTTTRQVDCTKPVFRELQGSLFCR